MVWPAVSGRLGEIDTCTASHDGMRPQLLSPSSAISASIRARVSGSREARQHRLVAADLHPGRQQVLQRVGAGGIRVGVAIDVATLGARPLDHAEDRRRLAPIVDARAFQMDDLDMDAGRAGDGDRLLDPFEHLVRFVADMGEVSRRCGASALRHSAMISSGRAKLPGGVNRPDDMPSAPALKPLVQQRDHPAELGRASGPGPPAPSPSAATCCGRPACRR